MRESIRISATEFKKQLGHWLEKAIGGETIEIVRHGGKSAVLTSADRRNESEPASKNRLQETSQPYRARTTLEAFREMQKKTEDRYELMDGRPLLLASPSVLHQRIVSRLFGFLLKQLDGRPCEVFSAPFDVTLLKAGAEQPDVVQPDLLVICDLPTSIDPGFQYEEAPKLVVEVLSPATRSRDMVAKLDLYMRSGVEEYWIVDPSTGSFIVYHFEDGEIASLQTAKGTDRFSSEALGGLEIDVSAAFRS